MDLFYSSVIIIAISLLILSLTMIGVYAYKYGITSEHPWPRSYNLCPDGWKEWSHAKGKGCIVPGSMHDLGTNDKNRIRNDPKYPTNDGISRSDPRYAHGLRVRHLHNKKGRNLRPINTNGRPCCNGNELRGSKSGVSEGWCWKACYNNNDCEFYSYGKSEIELAVEGTEWKATDKNVYFDGPYKPRKGKDGKLELYNGKPIYVNRDGAKMTYHTADTLKRFYGINSPGWQLGYSPHGRGAIADDSSSPMPPLYKNWTRRSSHMKGGSKFMINRVDTVGTDSKYCQLCRDCSTWEPNTTPSSSGTKSREKIHHPNDTPIKVMYMIDEGWKTGGRSKRCNFKRWANANNVRWTGVSNYNKCD